MNKYFNNKPKSQTSFQIYYSPNFKMYDFTVFNYKKEVKMFTIYSSLRDRHVLCSVCKEFNFPFIAINKDNYSIIPNFKQKRVVCI